MATVPQQHKENNWKSQLSPEHYESLSKGSGISDAVIAERGYRTITDVKELEALGFSKRQLRHYRYVRYVR